MPTTYFGIGSTLAGIVNVERTYGLNIHVVDTAAVPLTGSVHRRALSNKPRHDGAINSALLLDLATRAQLNTFMNAQFSGWNTPGVQRYLTLIDENGYYSPFLGYVEKPTFEIAPGGMLRGITFPLWDLTLQTLSKLANYTVTTADRLIYADSTSGSITFALPAAASVTAYTVYSFVKTVSANSMVLDPNGAELIDGASTKTITAQYGRADIVSTGSAWVSI